MTPRTFPHSLEAERALLGGLLLDAPQVEDIAALISEHDWYSPNHAQVWRWLLACHARGERPDTIALVNHALQKGNAEAWGGVAYLSSLPEQCPSTANLAHYARIIANKGKRRRLLALSADLERAAMDADDEDLPTKTASIAAEIDRVDAPKTPIAEIHSIAQGVIRQALHAHEVPPTHVRTGFALLDDALGWLRPGWVVIVAGRPGMGKTQLTLQIAEAHCHTEDGASLILSLEMPKEELATRLVAKHSGMAQRKVRDGVGHPADMTRIAESITRLDLAMWVDDTPAQTIAHMRASIRAAKRQAAQWGRVLSCVVVDYLQLAKGIGQSREQEVASIARGLKDLAKSEQVVVLAACQLNRGVEGRGDKRPMMSDLRESGEVEQAADIVLFPYRPGYYSETVPQDLAQVGIAKHRHGDSTGRWVDLGWQHGWFVHRPEPSRWR